MGSLSRNVLRIDLPDSPLCWSDVSKRERLLTAGAKQRNVQRRKKEGAIRAPDRFVPGLGFMAFRGHPRQPCRPDLGP